MNSGVERLEAAFDAARNDLTGTGALDPWANSPYRWLRELQSRTRGKAGEQIITTWLRSEGFSVTSPDSSDADRCISLHEVEIKLSTRWDSGVYTFQQIRDQEYRYAILLGVSPDRINVWVLPKAVALKFSTPQHTGKEGAETRWLSFPADNPPKWLKRYGGDIESGLQAIKKYLGTAEVDPAEAVVPVVNDTCDREWLLEVAEMQPSHDEVQLELELEEQD